MVKDGTQVIYVHGAGDQPSPDELKRTWDLALFGREMGDKTRMVYWADPMFRRRQSRKAEPGAPSVFHVNAFVKSLVIERGRFKLGHLVDALLRAAGVLPPGPGARQHTLPVSLRKPPARDYFDDWLRDYLEYFGSVSLREKVGEHFLEALLAKKDAPVVVVAHDLGSVVALEKLAGPQAAGTKVEHFITFGSPLGIAELQDALSLPELKIPASIRRWHNFADVHDPVVSQKGISADFNGGRVAVTDEIVSADIGRLEPFDPRAALGYLSHPKLRRFVQDSARTDTHARFLMARDVAAGLAVGKRQSILIEILEPEYPAVGETHDEAKKYEREKEGGKNDLASRIERASAQLEDIVKMLAPSDSTLPQRKKLVEDARIDPLERFISARLTPEEVAEVAKRHRTMRIYAIWKSSKKRKLIHRSACVVQADAAWARYAALGAGIRWAVLDTGVRADHPHFTMHRNIVEVWDCTNRGTPKKLYDRESGDCNDATKATDPDGHGTHVSGILAGQVPDPVLTNQGNCSKGIAPRAELVVYKVLDDEGFTEDAWVIKALDHIAKQNASRSGLVIHGVNFSAGGWYDSTVYGCGFSPLCVEFRRLWRNGVLVVVAAGNEGHMEVSTPEGEVEINTSLSIGDPANLEECIAVGSVNADRPHMYGVSAFSSRGPTSDGRVKPDVVAPGERISSCNSDYPDNESRWKALYREDSGTSMAAPHVSGLLAAFLSVRREFRGRPDEVKALMLRTCIDLGRDRYHQGHGMPNLMRMLLEA